MSAVQWLDGIIGNYGVTTAVVTAIAFAFLIPLRIFAHRNAVLKKKVAPLEVAIKEKYGINSLGASVTEDIDTKETEILAMEPKEREQKAAEEIEAVHKESGYHFYIGILPTAVESVFIVVLYFLISAACPEGIFSTVAFREFWTFSGTLDVMLIYGIFYGVNLLLNIVNIADIKPANKKAMVVSMCVRVLSFGLMVYISYKAIPAHLIAVLTLQVLSSLFNFVQDLVIKKKKEE